MELIHFFKCIIYLHIYYVNNAFNYFKKIINLIIHLNIYLKRWMRRSFSWTWFRPCRRLSPSWPFVRAGPSSAYGRSECSWSSQPSTVCLWRFCIRKLFLNMTLFPLWSLPGHLWSSVPRVFGLGQQCWSPVVTSGHQNVVLDESEYDSEWLSHSNSINTVNKGLVQIKKI